MNALFFVGAVMLACAGHWIGAGALFAVWLGNSFAGEP